MENTPENKIYSAGYAETFHGADDFSSEFSSFYEKEPDGEVGSSNLYVLASGTRNTASPEVTARFTAKKILYEFFHAYDFVDANRLAVAMRTANNEICEYARVQNDKMSASAIAASVTENKATIATVGGCRAYIIRNGKVFQITEDPAVIEEKVQSGEMSADEAYGSEGGPALLGTARDITTDIYDGIEVRSGDILLLCSGSLDTFIGKNEIMEAAADNSPRTIVQHLLGSPALQNANVPASAAAIPPISARRPEHRKERDRTDPQKPSAESGQHSRREEERPASGDHPRRSCRSAPAVRRHLCRGAVRTDSGSDP